MEGGAALLSENHRGTIRTRKSCEIVPSARELDHVGWLPELLCHGGVLYGVCREWWERRSSLLEVSRGAALRLLTVTKLSVSCNNTSSGHATPVSL